MKSLLSGHARQPKASRNWGFGFTTRRVRLETRRHREDGEKSLNRSTQSSRRRKKCGVYFVHAGTRVQNKRHGFLEEYVEGEEPHRCASFSLNYSQRGCGNYGCRTCPELVEGYSGNRNSRNISCPPQPWRRRITAAGYSRCLCVSSEAGGKPSRFEADEMHSQWLESAPSDGTDPISSHRLGTNLQCHIIC